MHKDQKLSKPVTVKIPLPAMKDKIAVYEDLLNELLRYTEDSLNNPQVREIITRLQGWSAAHGRGAVIKTKERDQQIAEAFWKLDLHQRHRP